MGGGGLGDKARADRAWTRWPVLFSACLAMEKPNLSSLGHRKGGERTGRDASYAPLPPGLAGITVPSAMPTP